MLPCGCTDANIVQWCHYLGGWAVMAGCFGGWLKSTGHVLAAKFVLIQHSLFMPLVLLFSFLSGLIFNFSSLLNLFPCKLNTGLLLHCPSHLNTQMALVMQTLSPMTNWLPVPKICVEAYCELCTFPLSFFFLLSFSIQSLLKLIWGPVGPDNSGVCLCFLSSFPYSISIFLVVFSSYFPLF